MKMEAFSPKWNENKRGYEAHLMVQSRYLIHLSAPVSIIQS